MDSEAVIEVEGTMAVQPVVRQVLLLKVLQLAKCLTMKAALELQLAFVVWYWRTAVEQAEVKTLFGPCLVVVTPQALESHGHIVE